MSFEISKKNKKGFLRSVHQGKIGICNLNNNDYNSVFLYFIIVVLQCHTSPIPKCIGNDITQIRPILHLSIQVSIRTFVVTLTHSPK